MDLTQIPIYDHHAYSLYHGSEWYGAPLAEYFSLASNPETLFRHTPNNLFFRRSIRDLAEFYDCEPSLEGVLEARTRIQYLDLCRWFFAEANLSHWLIDDGFSPGHLWSVSECDERLPPTARRILRLETELAKLIEHHDSASSLLASFEAHLRKLAPGVAAFKSVVAYRSGLDISRHNLVEIERAYNELRRGMVPGQAPRLSSKPLLDSMLWMALRVASETGRVVQFHTGFGDPDLDLRLANPLHLRGLLEAPEFAALKVVLLHAYPYAREAGYLASLYPGVYVDVGMSIPYTSVHAMRSSLYEAMHLAPISKILFSTSAQRTPEMFWLAARWGRRVISQVLEQTVYNADLSNEEAEWAAERMLYANAADLYGTFAS